MERSLSNSATSGCRATDRSAERCRSPRWPGRPGARRRGSVWVVGVLHEDQAEAVAGGGVHVAEEPGKSEGPDVSACGDAGRGRAAGVGAGEEVEPPVLRGDAVAVTGDEDGERGSIGEAQAGRGGRRGRLRALAGRAAVTGAGADCAGDDVRVAPSRAKYS